MPDTAHTTAAAPDRPGARERGRMRRRLRTQKHMREALLMDLGALVYELHHQGRRAPELLQAKAAEVAAVDQEVRGLADALEADAGTLAIVAAGVAGSCERCGSLLSTDDRYCGACGNPAVAGAAAPGAASGPQLARPAADAPARPAADAPAPRLVDGGSQDPGGQGETAETGAAQPSAGGEDGPGGLRRLAVRARFRRDG